MESLFKLSCIIDIWTPTETFSQALQHLFYERQITKEWFYKYKNFCA